PSAILFMQCGLKDCALEFRKFYETAMPTLEVGYEIVPSVIWTLEESDLQDMNAVYPNEIYERAVWNLKTEKGVLDVMVFLMRETPFAFPKEKEVEAMEEAYEEHSFDYSCGKRSGQGKGQGGNIWHFIPRNRSIRRTRPIWRNFFSKKGND